MAGCVWLLGWSELLRFKDLRVVGLQHATEAQVRHLADIPEGTPLVAVDLDAVVAGIERHPWVAEAEARRVFPDAVVVQVRERSVRAVLVLDGLFLVDEEGTPFRRADPDQLDHVFLTGIDRAFAESQPELARRVVNDGLAILDAALSSGELRESEISEVRFAEASGYVLALRNGGEIRLGFRGADALTRLPRLVAAGVDLDVPSRVDLGMDAHVVVTPAS